MKKFSFFTLFMIATLSLSAQSWSDNFQFGVKAGVNFATITGDDIDSPDGRTSFYAGLLAEVPLTERLSLQPEVFYSGQGFDITDDPNKKDAEYQLDYIQVPVLVKIYLVEGLNIHAGPQFSFKINEEIDLKPNADSGDTDINEAKDFDFGLTAGLGYKVLENFLIEARYTYGFTDLLENSNIHNSVFSVGVGFMF